MEDINRFQISSDSRFHFPDHHDHHHTEPLGLVDDAISNNDPQHDSTYYFEDVIIRVS
jgi:hypothetical protein